MLNAAIGGWQLSGTMFYHSGFPFSFIDGGTSAALDGNNLFGSTILLQPEFSQRNFSNVASCVLNPCWGPGTANTFAATTSFVGTVGRNAFRGPGFLGGDMSIRKDFRVTERVGFQLGLNAYNFRTMPITARRIRTPTLRSSVKSWPCKLRLPLLTARLRQPLPT